MCSLICWALSIIVLPIWTKAIGFFALWMHKNKWKVRVTIVLFFSFSFFWGTFFAKTNEHPKSDCNHLLSRKDPLYKLLMCSLIRWESSIIVLPIWTKAKGFFTLRMCKNEWKKLVLQFLWEIHFTLLFFLWNLLFRDKWTSNV